MWVRMILAPWWIRALILAGFITLWVVVLFAIMSFEGRAWFEDGGFDPKTVIVVVVMSGLGLSLLLAVAVGQSQRLYRAALAPAGSPAKQAEAIAAAKRGPVPLDPQVREAAAHLAGISARNYRRHGQRMIVINVIGVAALLLLTVRTLVTGEPREAFLPVMLVLLFGLGAAWVWWARRRAVGRQELFDSAAL